MQTRRRTQTIPRRMRGAMSSDFTQATGPHAMSLHRSWARSGSNHTLHARCSRGLTDQHRNPGFIARFVGRALCHVAIGHGGSECIDRPTTIASNATSAASAATAEATASRSDLLLCCCCCNRCCRCRCHCRYPHPYGAWHRERWRSSHCHRMRVHAYNLLREGPPATANLLPPRHCAATNSQQSIF